jgi:hypothetical protein
MAFKMNYKGFPKTEPDKEKNPNIAKLEGKIEQIVNQAEGRPMSKSERDQVNRLMDMLKPLHEQ